MVRVIYSITLPQGGAKLGCTRDKERVPRLNEEVRFQHGGKTIRSTATAIINSLDSDDVHVHLHGYGYVEE